MLPQQKCSGMVLFGWGLELFEQPLCVYVSVGELEEWGWVVIISRKSVQYFETQTELV